MPPSRRVPYGKSRLKILGNEVSSQQKHSFPIEDCISQSYDNAGNMRGSYHEMQTWDAWDAVMGHSAAAENVRCPFP